MSQKLKEIQKMPTVMGNVHESAFRSYSILQYVLEMIERNDSQETIFEVVELLKHSNIDKQQD